MMFTNAMKLLGQMSWLQNYLTRRNLALVVATAVVGCKLSSAFKAHMIKKHYSRLRQERRTEAKRSIDKVKGAVGADKDVAANKDVITKLPAKDLVAYMKAGKLSALEVLRAFQAKALEAHEATNCVTEFIAEAEEQARKCDSSTTKDGELFGLPISLKEHYIVKGYNSACGSAPALGDVAESDCEMVKALKNEGAIPFVRTNVPHAMLSVECCNPIFGWVKNPHDLSRGPGGSSGGESALIAYGASPLGMGSDHGGSIRIPSAFCGICGFKPTPARISMKGFPPIPVHIQQIEICLGPMAPNVDACVSCMRVLWNGHMAEQDHKLIPIKFDNEVYESTRPLRIGYYEQLEGCQTVVPAVRRSVRVAVTALQKQGHTLVKWDPPRPKDAIFLWYDLLLADGWHQLCEFLKYDTMISESVDFTIGRMMKPKWRKYLSALWISLFDADAGKIEYSRLGVSSTSKWYQLVDMLLAYHTEFANSWKNAGLDAVIGPTWPTPAMPLKSVAGMATGDLYCGSIHTTMLYNTLPYPAGVVPVTTVSRDDLDKMSQYPEHTELDRALKQGMRGSEGLPICIQCIAPSMRDEMALRVMKEVETGLQNI